ncbi:MAG TPA: glycosyltransferase family 9 protein [Vicinamibacterales bacterium]|nr:glycosyltransferase family 9 protein [Vicinamibacterales bacterium]
MADSAPERILLVRLGALGDIVHAIPVAAALRRAFPSARIDWLVSAKHREILDLVPVIDRRLVINDRPSASVRRDEPRGEVDGGTSLLQAIGELRRARYDVAIDLQGLIKSAVLARASGAARVVGFAASYVRERLARIFYTDVYDPGSRGVRDHAETRHIVDINLGLLAPLGITTTAAEFPIERVSSTVAHTVGEQTGGRYALLNPGAAWPNKRWPPARFGAVARALRERHGLTSAVLWGPREEPLAREVVAASDGAAVLAPQTTIADLVALGRGAALIVSGDTGPTHIAAAVGTPIVSLFGPTRPQRNGPWSPQDVAVSRDTICQCHHLRRCTKPSMCLLDIQVDEVLRAIDRRLAGERR